MKMDHPIWPSPSPWNPRLPPLRRLPPVRFPSSFLLPEWQEESARLGPEPLDPELTAEGFHRASPAPGPRSGRGCWIKPKSRALGTSMPVKPYSEQGSIRRPRLKSFAAGIADSPLRRFEMYFPTRSGPGERR